VTSAGGTKHDWRAEHRENIAPPRPRARSMSPVPATLDLEDVRKINAVRERLRLGLRTTDTLGALRAFVVELVDDMQAGALDPQPEEQAADTLRSYGHPDDESAPPTPRDSPEGEEYGV
jgi:hypothetical protein